MTGCSFHGFLLSCAVHSEARKNVSDWFGRYICAEI